MKRGLTIVAVVSAVALPISFALPTLAQYSPFAMPSWYDYGVMRRQIINGGEVESRSEEYEEPTEESFDSEINNSSPSPAISDEEYDLALQAYKEASASVALPASDLATAMTFFTIVNYAIATGQSEEPPDSVSRAIYNQFSQLLTQNGQFQTASAGEQQSIAEGLGTMGAMMYLAFQYAQQQGDVDTQTQLRQAAQNNLESFAGVPFNQIRLTENGVAIQ
ncbi:MAG: hypothetical protein MUD14_00270 [Hydrococcus sp. Prado102]|jgi:hypothetical protein|nr:hypothetical protein [Hydrococcus sp. Prado102]